MGNPNDPYGLRRPWYPASACEMTVTDIDHGEGVAVGVDGLIRCGGEEGQVYHCPPGSVRPDPIARLPGRALGVALDAADTSYWCDQTGAAVYAATPTGRVRKISRGVLTAPFRVPNYPAFLPDGRLVMSESGGYGRGDGTLLSVAPGGATRILRTAAVGFTNGLCVSAGGRTLYVVESTLPGVSALTRDDDGPRATTASSSRCRTSCRMAWPWTRTAASPSAAGFRTRSRRCYPTARWRPWSTTPSGKDLTRPRTSPSAALAGTTCMSPTMASATSVGSRSPRPASRPTDRRVRRDIVAVQVLRYGWRV